MHLAPEYKLILRPIYVRSIDNVSIKNTQFVSSIKHTDSLDLMHLSTIWDQNGKIQKFVLLRRHHLVISKETKLRMVYYRLKKLVLICQFGLSFIGQVWCVQLYTDELLFSK